MLSIGNNCLDALEIKIMLCYIICYHIRVLHMLIFNLCSNKKPIFIVFQVKFKKLSQKRKMYTI